MEARSARTKLAKGTGSHQEIKTMAFKKWMCSNCGFIYDEAAGRPEEGIAPGTRWDDVPAAWVCPDCGTGKADFEMVEM